MKTRFQSKRLLPYSLKSRIVLLLLLSAIIPLLLIGSVSNYSIHSILENKIEKGVQSNLRQTRLAMESVLNDMDYTSRQFALEGHIGSKFDEFIHSEDVTQKSVLFEEISKNMVLLNYTNPNIGQTFYYLPNSNQYFFETQLASDSFNPADYSVLAEKNGAVFHGPHLTMNRYNQATVFSLLRRLTDKNEKPQIYVYLETNVTKFEELLNNRQYGLDAYHWLTDRDGKVVYTQNDGIVSIGEKPDFEPGESGYGRLKGYYIFTEKSDSGWGLSVAVNAKSYTKETKSWFRKTALSGGLSMLVSLFLAWLIWRNVYLPLNRLNREIHLMSNNLANDEPSLPAIQEFDHLLLRFFAMRKRISQLLQEVEEKEERKRRLEVEKLLYQINPHFLHNTLNTIQVLARMNQVKEIDRIVSVFSRVLHYNLGKEGGTVRIEEEIKALRDYVELQQIRYDYHFDVVFEVDPTTLDVHIPRFLLQPLVENALYHGLKDADGTITVRINREDGLRIRLTVQDNGSGMAPDVMNSLLGEKTDGRRRAGIGIGLGFVKNVVYVHYGDRAILQIDSEPGRGTTISWLLPQEV